MNPKDFKGLPYSKWDIDQDILINSLPLEIVVKRKTLYYIKTTYKVSYKLHIKTHITNDIGGDHQVIYIDYSNDQESIFGCTYEGGRNLDIYIDVIKHLIKLHE